MSRIGIWAFAIVVVGGVFVAMVRAQERGSRQTGQAERSVLRKESETANTQSAFNRGVVGSGSSSSKSRIAERLKRLRGGNTTQERRGTAEVENRFQREPEAKPAVDGNEPGLLRAPVAAGDLDEKPAGAPQEPVFSAARREGATTREEAGDEVLSQSSGPALSVQTVGPRAIVIGKESTYTVHLTNSGRELADEVLVRVALPTWLELVSNDATSGTAQAQAAGDGQHVIWTVADVSGSAREKLQLRVIPRENRTFELAVDWTLRPRTEVTLIEVQQPELELFVTGPRDILYGETVAYTLRLVNPGTGDAENVSVDFRYGEKALPAKAVGLLAAGEEVELDVELTAQQAGTLDLTARASGDGGLEARINEEVLVRRAYLEVKLAGAPLKYAGSVATYQVQVRNTGDAPANSVVALISLPEGAKILGGQEVDSETNAFSTSLGTLAIGAEKTFQLACQLNHPGENLLRVRAEGETELTASESFLTQVEALADLKLAVNDPQGPTAVGAPAEYEVRIENRGTKAATQVKVVAQFSAGVEPRVADGAKARVVPGQVVFRPIPRIGPGETVSLKITATASQAGNHRFRAEVNCLDPETLLVAEESTHFFESDTVSSKPADSRVR